MKVMILGASGMAGHMLVKYFRGLTGYEVVCTTRDSSDPSALRLDATQLEETEHILKRERPSIVINAIGILNQHAEDNPREAELVNAWFPHRVAAILDGLGYGGKLVHISTDCVFSGKVDDGYVYQPGGRYREQEMPDGTSVYARTKAAGEVREGRHLTIRTSIIGPEIRPCGIGLMHWFMKQQGTVLGYAKVLWNGVTTLQLARSIERLVQRDASGLVHLTAPQIVSKYELLQLLAETFDKRDVHIVPSDTPQLDRTLVRSRHDAVREVPDYRTMLAELRDWMRSA
jgi:dTDP-4-dehydrorhamnose reductase